MRVLAIDTALEACSAGVLDTERAGVVAHESRAMLRGHAEALIPLIARVRERAISGISASAWPRSMARDSCATTPARSVSSTPAEQACLLYTSDAADE